MLNEYMTLARVYIDYVLLGISGICGITALILAVYLLTSRKRSKRYKIEITETMEKMDSSSIVQKMTANSESAQIPVQTGPETADATVALTPDSGGENNDGTVFVNLEPSFFMGLDISALEGKYVLERELGGGGMSRVFLGRSVKLGNQWIVKYIERSKGKLANEEDILKRLNHINLPSIIDIFHSDTGVFIVQSYIEGVALNEILKSGDKINKATVVEWIQELAQVLDYLHSLTPYPIIHCDLKPSNIMITRDSKLVLIDFGISKQYGLDDNTSGALTLQYAAPEQFRDVLGQQRIREFVFSRFGPLPREVLNWNIDNRTDIFSLGIIFFELLTGEIPMAVNLSCLKSYASKELAAMVYRCIPLAPAERYGSVKELLSDLQSIKNKHVRMIKSLVMRKVSAVISSLLFLMSGGLLAGGSYIMQNENLALVEISLDAAIISEQQIAEIYVHKILPSGDVKIIDPGLITWSYSGDNIARVDGNRIAGLNEGETEIIGMYRNRVISMSVKVVQPVRGLVDVSLLYRTGNYVDTFAGNGMRDMVDGPLLEASFVLPESIAIDDEGVIYLVDSGNIRVISHGEVATINLEPSFIQADKVRSFGNTLYVLTKEWQEETGTHYGLVKLDGGGAELLHLADAVFTRIDDFVVTQDMLYYIEYNGGLREKQLKSIDLTTGDIYTYTSLTPGAAALCLDGRGGVYIADSERAVIENYDFNSGTMYYVAGIEGQRHFIDGGIPHFYEPFRLAMADDMLYVLDFNVLRGISLPDGIMRFAETVAGEVSTESNPATVNGPASDVVFAHSSMMDFVITDGRVLLTDPKKSVIHDVLILQH